ncbi:hypothetical protein ZIOFF_025618 [Zingiber officinale]|uniref:F-box domain-containing protein n=1 Tax=Zingiber officinale TaxID=94328 RepID=A0A8J5H2U7_ZINOF|nr:hypothetical protein ZIOFF_025618 [Zingiber officinale]
MEHLPVEIIDGIFSRLGSARDVAAASATCRKWREAYIKQLPVEVIGNILSRLESARVAVLVSATCRKWREAYIKHLHTLSFNSNDWPCSINPRQLETIMIKVIFGAKGLQHLSIHLDTFHEFLDGPIIACLLHTSGTLLSLSYNALTTPAVNVLDKCGQEKLEVLVLDYKSLTEIKPSYKIFTCLIALSLRHVKISAFDLTRLLGACPRIESLTLDAMEIVTSDSHSPMELSSTTLKFLLLKSIVVDKIVLEADNLESLHLNDLNLDSFELIGKSNLEHLKIHDVIVSYLNIGEYLGHLKIVDVSNVTIMVLQFYHMISRASKLRTLRLRGVVFEDEDEMINSEFIIVSFPELKHIALSYESSNELLYNWLKSSSMLENVDVLELRFTVISENFGQWISGMIEKSPNLKKLVIHDTLSKTRIPEEHQMLTSLASLEKKQADVIGNERDEEMERVLEQQAHLIGQFEEEEKAQQKWEKKYNENKTSNLVRFSLRHGGNCGTVVEFAAYIPNWLKRLISQVAS